MKLNLHEECRTLRAFGPAAMTTVAGLAGKIIDRKGYNGVEFVVNYGAVTATNATISVVVKEGDTSGALTSVADTFLCGTEALAALPAQATARTSGTGKFVSTRVGYKGNKRFVQCSIAASTVTNATVVSGTAVLFAPEAAATASP